MIHAISPDNLQDFAETRVTLQADWENEFLANEHVPILGTELTPAMWCDISDPELPYELQPHTDDDDYEEDAEHELDVISLSDDYCHHFDDYVDRCDDDRCDDDDDDSVGYNGDLYED